MRRSMDAAEEAELPQWEGGSPFLILGRAAVCQLLLAGLRILSCAVTSPRGWLESCSAAPQQQKPFGACTALTLPATDVDTIFVLP